MIPGFTFNSIHSSEFNLTMRSIDRTTLPPLRKREVMVPGKHGTYDFGNNKYDNRIIQIECFLKADNLPQLRQRVRSVAGWLKDKGQLMFDDEQDKFYIGRLYNQIPLEQITTNGIISLAFECEPFAYSSLNMTETERTDETPIFIFNNGSVETPAEYTITNAGASPVSTIRVKVIQRI